MSDKDSVTVEVEAGSFDVIALEGGGTTLRSDADSAIVSCHGVDVIVSRGGKVTVEGRRKWKGAITELLEALLDHKDVAKIAAAMGSCRES